MMAVMWLLSVLLLGFLLRSLLVDEKLIEVLRKIMSFLFTTAVSFTIFLFLSFRNSNLFNVLVERFKLPPIFFTAIGLLAFISFGLCLSLGIAISGKTQKDGK